MRLCMADRRPLRRADRRTADHVAIHAATTRPRVITMPYIGLETAARIHYSFLPESVRTEKIDLAIRHRPVQTLGGDYCSAFWITENRLAVCMCDVVGHGVASALYAARVNTFVLAHARMVTHPCELIIRLNQFLLDKLADAGV
jgi:phosphoserine phosphatase RsbU/P